MKASIFISIISILLFSSLQHANASDTIFIKFISSAYFPFSCDVNMQKGDTTNVFLSEVVRIDTIHLLMQLSTAAGKKLELRGGYYSNCLIFLNTGNEEWVNVNVLGHLSDDISVDPSVTYGGGIQKDNTYIIPIVGKTWKTLAKKYGKAGIISW